MIAIFESLNGKICTIAKIVLPLQTIFRIN
mgnify:CR=1 FL=1